MNTDTGFVIPAKAGIQTPLTTKDTKGTKEIINSQSSIINVKAAK